MDKNKIIKLKEELCFESIDIENVDVNILKIIKNNIKNEVKDFRQPWKVRYKLWDIIVTTIIAILCNNNSMTDIHDFIILKKDFFKKFLMLTNGIASQDTYERVLSLISSETLQTCLNYCSCLFERYSNEPDIISLDGKVDKGSSRKKSLTINEEIKPLNVLNAYSINQTLCLYSKPIEDKTNEIPEIPNVLKKLNIKDTIITWDALNTQTKNIEAVINEKGDYVVPLKANQGNFYSDVSLYFNDDMLEKIKIGKSKSVYKKIIEKNNSCVIKYEYYQTEDVKWYFKYQDWKKLNSIGLVKKTIDNGTNITVEKRYYISSLYNDIELFSKAIRTHWQVENKLHWHLDFTFKQDENTTTNKKLLFNIQLIKKFVLGLLEKVKGNYNISLNRIRHRLEINIEKELSIFLKYLYAKTNKKSKKIMNNPR